MISITLSLPLFLFPAADVDARAPAAPAQQAAPQPARDESAFEEARRAFAGAMRDYDEQRLRAGREKRPLGAEHPARLFWKRMSKLADEGSVLARAWMLKNIREGYSDMPTRAALTVDLFEKLVATAPEDECMLDALVGLQSMAREIGPDKAASLAEQLAQATKHHEVAARALLTQAAIVSSEGKAGDPAALENARAIQHSIIYLYPKTSAAKSASFQLLPELERELRAAFGRWIADVRALQAAGKGPEAWPAVPLHDFEPHYVTLASAQNSEAARWTGTLFPAFEQASKNGPGHALSWLVEQLGVYYSPRDPDWARVRAGILTAILEQYPDAPWVRSALNNLSAEVERLPARAAEGPANAVLSKSTTPSLRALALLLRAHTQRRSGDQEGYEAALVDYRSILEKYPDENPARLAKVEVDALVAAMPGAVAPELAFKNDEGAVVDLAQQTGRVVLVVFWQFMESECADVMPKIAELDAELTGRRFVIIGLNADRADRRTYVEQADKLGWRWPAGRSMTAEHPLLSVWQIRRWPTCVLVDHKGKIAARDLPWSRMVSLAKELVAAAER